jgi:4-carboxymuconolactone decarboxylase
MSGPRFPQLELEKLQGDQRSLAENILKVSSLGIQGPYNPLLRSPVMGQRMLDLLDYLRWNSAVPTRLTELAIMIQARLWRSQVEWFAHYPISLRAGLSPELLADLKANKRPANMQEDEAAVYDFCTELSTEHAVSDETYARAKAILGDQGLVDLTVISGTYVTVAMMLAMAEATVPPGKEAPFGPNDP